jgi:hypothetical protein
MDYPLEWLTFAGAHNAISRPEQTHLAIYHREVELRTAHQHQNIDRLGIPIAGGYNPYSHPQSVRDVGMRVAQREGDLARRIDGTGG